MHRLRQQRWATFAAAAATAVACFVHAGYAQVTASWAVDADGSWWNASNWAGGTPPGATPGDSATLGPVITAPRTVTLGAPATLANLTLSAPFAYHISGSSTALTLANPGGPALVESQGAAHSIVAPVALSSDTDFDTDSDLLLPLALSGSGGLTKLGPGTLTLGSANAPNANAGYAGAVDVREGTLRAGAAAAFGTGPVTVEPGATLDMTALVGRGNTYTGALTLRGATAQNTSTTTLSLGGAVQVAGRGSWQGAFGFGSADGSSGSLSGSGGLWLDGSASLRVASSHHDGTYLQGGTLTLTPTGSLVGTGPVVAGPRAGLAVAEDAGQSTDAHAVVLHGGSLTLTGDIDPAALLGPLSSSGTLLLGTNVTHDVTLSPTLRLGGTGKGTMSGQIHVTPGGDGTLRLAGGSLLSIDSPLLAANGITGLRAEQGSVRLDAASDYAGPTLVQSGAVLSVANPQALGLADTAPAGGTEVDAGGRLDLSGVTITGEGLRLTNGGRLFGYGQWAGPVELVGSGSLENNSPNISLAVTGVISGTGDLRRNYPTDVGTVELSAANSYTGATRLGLDGHGAVLRLTGNGSILPTSGVYLDPGATLELNDTITNLPDDGAGAKGRIDSTLHLRGGTLQFVGNASDPASVEHLPDAQLDYRASKLISVGSSTAGVTHQLVIDSLTRQPGSSLVVPILTGNQNVGTPGNQILIGNATLNDGVLADARGTAYGIVLWNNGTTPDFATYGASGLALLTNTTPDINSATPTTNVKVTADGTTTLTASRTINSLNLSGFGTLDLGGHNLVIDSGGLINQFQFYTTPNYIQNGTLTAGTPGAGGELNIFLGTAIKLEISAAITDNGTGPVAVTKNSQAQLVLSGANSYTGPTTLNEGELDFGAGAFPAGGDLTVNNGRALLYGPGTVPIGRLTVRSVQKQTTAANLLAGVDVLNSSVKLSPQTVLLEAGTIDAELTGTAPLTKSTPNAAALTTASPGWSGPIDVQEGSLSAPGPALGTGPVIVRPAGQLSLSGTAANPVTLAGGILTDASISTTSSATLAGPLTVSDDARLLPSKQTQITGPLSISPAKSLTVDGGTGAGTLVISGPQSPAPGAKLAIDSATVRLTSDPGPDLDVDVRTAGLLSVARPTLQLGHVDIDGGAVTLAPGGHTLVTSALTFGGATTPTDPPPGWVDLADGQLRVTAQSPADVARLVAAVRTGYASGTWIGAGIGSSFAASDPLHLAAIGWRSDPAADSLSDLLFAYTFYGDANLDGVVNADDYALVDRGLAKRLTGWSNGDFNYDGTIDQNDYLLIDTTYLQQQGGTPSPAFLAERASQFGDPYVRELISSVPEPASPLACLVAGLLFARRRRRLR